MTELTIKSVFVTQDGKEFEDVHKAHKHQKIVDFVNTFYDKDSTTSDQVSYSRMIEIVSDIVQRINVAKSENSSDNYFYSAIMEGVDV